MNELRNRGVQDILIAVVDGLKGFPEAITAAFPETMVQTCIVHLIHYFDKIIDGSAIAVVALRECEDCVFHLSRSFR
jgi:transposase-like protein